MPQAAKRLVQLTLAGVLLAVMPVTVMAADGPGTCGKGKRWDADTQTCVPKPKAPGSGSAAE